MGVEWTEEQHKVITLRNRNILVSAAAGSGKTAVLVERIIQKILDPDNPVDIDRLVIVTFTKAAAGEMKERIQRAIEEQASVFPENSHLQRQKTLIHRANITTIHSFCKKIIQDHFQEIELDPSFRIIDEGEWKLLKRETVKEILEEYYIRGSEQFHQFVEVYAAGKDDENIENLILELYDYAMSYPWPKEWLWDCVKLYEAAGPEELQNASWMRNFIKSLQIMAASLLEKAAYAMELVMSPSGPYMQAEVIQYYYDLLKTLKESREYEIWYEALSQMQHPALSRKKDSAVDSGLRNIVKELRDEIKEELESLKKYYFCQPLQETLADLKLCSQPVGMLVEITCAFMELFHEKKRKRNLVDYQDLEHDALSILTDRHGNPTETAKEYGQYFEEILIDEYQDSNLVQELLLTSVSKKALGRNNIFMVGDSKQSIYSFRLARPELFLQKFDAYTLEDSPCQRIDLHKNFRSRQEVLQSTNYIFAKIMQKILGGITYDRQAALYVGAEYPEPLKRQEYDTELLMFDNTGLKEEFGIDSRECEAKIIAQRIRKLVDAEDGISIADKNTGGYRKAEYRDIVILLRSPKGYAQAMLEILAAEGVPAHVISGEGYFDTIEVVTILNFLRIIDNPVQDIPLAAVLRSPIGNITDQELAMIKAGERENSLYGAVMEYIGQGSDTDLKRKLADFISRLNIYRKKAAYMQLHDFIWYLLDVTGYEDYIYTMPAGEQRKANVEMLVEKAIAFEQTSYLGLFQFIQYIEQLQKYEVDFGEAAILNEKDNTVRIMSIHKSKGLEFPVVFVAGLGKKFNQMDIRKPVVSHPDIGIGVDSVQLDTRQKNVTLIKRVIQRQTELENMGEELRILYVAMTRAKEKLILVGGMKNFPKQLSACAKYPVRNTVPFDELCRAGNYLRWILSALIHHKSLKRIREDMDIANSAGFLKENFEAEFIVAYIDLDGLLLREFETISVHEKDRQDLEKQLSQRIQPVDNKLKEILEYQYPYKDEINLSAKISVSEIKKRNQQWEVDGKQIYEVPDIIPLYPDFMRDEVGLTPTARGSAYHKILECIDWKSAETKEDIKTQIIEMQSKGILDSGLAKSINYARIFAFAQSELGIRIKKAAQTGRLYREQPFMLGVPANKLQADTSSTQTILVQGIIDAYFEENGSLVLIDYKTDRIQEGEEWRLIEQYRMQLDYYVKALSGLTGMQVKEKILYSMELNKAIQVV